MTRASQETVSAEFWTSSSRALESRAEIPVFSDRSTHPSSYSWGTLKLCSYEDFYLSPINLPLQEAIARRKIGESLFCFQSCYSETLTKSLLMVHHLDSLGLASQVPMPFAEQTRSCGQQGRFCCAPQDMCSRALATQVKCTDRLLCHDGPLNRR